MVEASYHCGHTGCRCMLGKGQGEFCGDYCRQAAQQPATEARSPIANRKCIRLRNSSQTADLAAPLAHGTTAEASSDFSTPPKAWLGSVLPLLPALLRHGQSAKRVRAARGDDSRSAAIAGTASVADAR
jgi:hypothetical protein